MTKKIIILERVGEPSDEAYRVAFWLDVPLARQSFYAKPATFVSQWINASVAENEALRAGTIEEVVNTYVRPAGTTLAQMAAFLQAEYAQAQTRMAQTNPWVRYGTFWDGSSWTQGGVT